MQKQLEGYKPFAVLQDIVIIMIIKSMGLHVPTLPLPPHPCPWYFLLFAVLGALVDTLYLPQPLVSSRSTEA